MNIRETYARAWKLPVFAVFYVLVSYLADTLGRILLYRNSSEWLCQMWFQYVHMWFSTYALLSAPAWLLFHGSLLFTGIRYYRSCLSRWGWWLVVSALACSAAGGYCVDMLFLTLESVIRHVR